MSRDRQTCQTCGKHSGLDDLVHSAMTTGVHSTNFMLDILQNGPRPGAESAPHCIICSNCGDQFGDDPNWSLNWKGAIWKF